MLPRPAVQALVSRGQFLSKNSSKGRTAALASRIDVLTALAREMAISELPPIRRTDEAAAAILALSAADARQRRATLIVENPEEGSFLVALTEPDARHLKPRSPSISNDNTAVDAQLISLKSDATPFATVPAPRTGAEHRRSLRQRRRLTHA